MTNNFKVIMKLPVLFVFLFISIASLAAQDNPQPPALSVITIFATRNSYYTFRYKDFKPDDVPQEVYDGLWEIQKEVIDNFTYDYAAMRDMRKFRYLTTREEFYEHGRGVCENYADFFILLARESNLTENLYKVSGKRRNSGHAWLEYRTENNIYIIDPTWSDDYFIREAGARQEFKESRAYGRRSFFTTYAEDRSIYTGQGYNHSSYTGKTAIPLWESE